MSLGVNVFNYLQGLDYGDVQVILGQTEPSYELITEGVLRIVEAGAVPVCMGGDHSVTLPELRAVAAHHGAVALVHLDAHPDTWDELYETEYNHGTPMRRAVEEGLVAPENSVHVGLRGSQYDAGCWEQSQQLGFELLPMEEVDAMGLEAVVERIRARTGDRAVFLSVDIDVLDPAYAPGTGTPEVGGFTTREALRLMRGLAGLRFVGFDLVELLPAHDSNNITALAGAQLIFEFLSLLAVERRNAVEPG
jgi:agmatinase